ncbi:MAG: hypothetical protein K0R98_261 [Rickettsiaceae bacterium]|jgi:ankyrin repeat protein|nr:hypothetical protein [Rickettsiaceae bacterium]
MSKLIDAILSGDVDEVQSLIENGANLNEDNGIALYKAINEGYIEISKLLLKNGAKMQGNSSSMPLYSAAGNGWFDVVKQLVENGAEVNPANGLPLICAIRSKNFEIVKYLIEKGADVNNPKLLAIAKSSSTPEIAHFLEQCLTGEKMAIAG